MHELAGIIKQAIEQEANGDVTSLIENLSPAELARVLEALQSPLRLPLWAQVPTAQKGEVLLELHGDLLTTLIENTSEDELVDSLSAIQMDELADLDEYLPISVVNAMVAAMDVQRRQRYAAVKLYPDDTAGGLMDIDATAVRADVSLKAVLRYLRKLRQKEGELPEHLDSLMAVDRNNKFLGMLPLSNLVSYDLQTTVGEALVDCVTSIKPLTSAKEVARVFEDQDLLSAPVLDDNGVLLGRITVDDVIDVMRDQAERNFLGRAGLEKHPDMFAPVLNSSLKRAVWLGINLITAFAAAWVIGLFEASIEKVVALAILMPVVASMGGVTGSQTLTLVTRGIALEQIGSSNVWRLLSQELVIGSINGLFWGAVVAGIAIVWFGDWTLGLIFAMALVVVILTGAVSGTLIPLGLKHLGIDPALAGGVVLTTATDMVGFFAFLGLATLVLI